MSAKKPSKGIEVYIRVRPAKNPDKRQLTLHPDDNKVEFNFDRDGLKIKEHRQESYTFEFSGILDMLTRQERVFEVIAKDVIESCFDGFNGTIFAYGQTGSGKTYSITGGAERYADRGIIPRTLSYIFGRISKNTTHQYSVNVSYLEIYNNDGFDLLDENHSTKNLYDLQKVQVQENLNNQFVLKGLSVHRAENEEDALNLLFIGDTNRVVSETPKNDSSTRSHCIFIIQIESQQMGQDVKTVSKLHIVDLSGSERPSDTGIDGKILKEALHINGSLLQLSIVIQNLNKQAKNPKDQTHISYRSSMMTMVLRDSLGGNCKTKMLATLSPQTEDLHESLSTCRFAKNVSMIQNKVTRNETVDPGVIISRLKKEVSDLKAELAMAKGGEQRDHLSAEDIERCNLNVKDFIDSNDMSKSLVMPDRLMINQCFYHFKSLYKNLEKKKGGKGIAGITGPPQLAIKEDEDEKSEKGGSGKNNSQLESEIQRLNMLVKQRDQEMGIMLQYLNKKKAGDANASMNMGSATGDIPVQRSQSPPGQESMKGAVTNNGFEEKNEESKQGGGGTLFQMMSAGKGPYGNAGNMKSIKEKRMDFELNQQNAQATLNQNTGHGQQVAEVNQMVHQPIQCTIEDLADRAKAFDMFRKSYRKNEAMEENRQTLKEKYGMGKQLGIEVNQSRQAIKKYTNDIEQIRKQNAMRGLVDDNGEIIKTPEEDAIQNQITASKKSYQVQYNQLKDLKQEIERIQALLERCREKLQRDFEQWLQVMIKQKQMEQANGGGQNGQSPAPARNGNGGGAFPVFKPQANQPGTLVMNNKQLGQANAVPPYMREQQNNSAAKQMSASRTNVNLGATDAKVQDSLKDFYKARDAIYNETQGKR